MNLRDQVTDSTIPVRNSPSGGSRSVFRLRVSISNALALQFPLYGLRRYFRAVSARDVEGPASIAA